MDIKLSFFSLNKLKKFIKAHKDNIPKSGHFNVAAIPQQWCSNIFAVNLERCNIAVKDCCNVYAIFVCCMGLELVIKKQIEIYAI